MQGPDTTGNELARWLQEAGRRRAAPPQAQAGRESAPPAAEPARKQPSQRRLRPLLLLAIAAVAAMPYLYADVHLTIYKLRSLIVFILNG